MKRLEWQVENVQFILFWECEILKQEILKDDYLDVCFLDVGGYENVEMEILKILVGYCFDL